MAKRVFPGRLGTVMEPPCATTTASTQAGAGALAGGASVSRPRGVGPGEPLEQLRQQFRRNPGTVIGHAQLDPRPLRRGTALQRGRSLRISRLPDRKSVV